MRNPFNFKLKDEPTHEQQSLDLLTDPIVRMDSGRFALDKFGVGNFDAFRENRR